jgi:hypothetical protein
VLTESSCFITVFLDFSFIISLCFSSVRGLKTSTLRVDGRGFNSTLGELEGFWVESEPSGVENVIAGQNYGPQILDFRP